MNKNINGTITFKDCQNVKVENIDATCTDYAVRAAACLTARYSDKMKAGYVSIRQSRCLVGSNQVGILAVNTKRVIIEDNVIIGEDGKMNAPANQGIVVAGSIAEDVHILHNRISGVTQGIHLGTSQAEKKRSNPVSANTVIVSDNYIQCLSPVLNNALQKIHLERHGIFIGNVNSVVLMNNYIDVTKPSGEIQFEGIRIFGSLGKRLIVKYNHLSNCGPKWGIYINVLNPNSWPKPVWVVEENVASVSILPSGNKFIERLNFA
jgi:hypothetical protein